MDLHTLVFIWKKMRQTHPNLEKVRQALDDMSTYAQIGEGTITNEISDEADWRDNWKAYFLLFPSAIFLLNLPGKTCRRTNRT